MKTALAFDDDEPRRTSINASSITSSTLRAEAVTSTSIHAGAITTGSIGAHAIIRSQLTGD